MAKTDKKIFFPKTVLKMPLGTLKFPNLTKPSTHQFDTDKCAAGQYKVQVLYKPNDKALAAFEKTVNGIYDAGVALLEKEKAKAKTPKEKKALELQDRNPLHKPDTDKDGNETGFVVIQSKVAAEDKNGVPTKLIIVDAKKNPMPRNSEIWGGTTANVAVQAQFYNSNMGSGVSLRLVGAQIINLVAGGSNAAPTMAEIGFEEAEGYEAQSADDAATTTEEEEDNVPF